MDAPSKAPERVFLPPIIVASKKSTVNSKLYVLGDMYCSEYAYKLPAKPAKPALMTNAYTLYLYTDTPIQSEAIGLPLKAFAVAIIGGLTSGMGIIIGGIILGVAETTTGFYISTGYKDVPGLVLLLLVLAVKPAGLFGKSAIKKV